MSDTIKFETLTPKQVAMICNGCGGKGGVVPVPNFFWEASCDKHDLSYSIGCTEADRKIADDGFYAAMLRDVDHAAKKKFILWRWLYRMNFRAIAFAYYSAVRKFGGSYFYYGDRKRTIEELTKV